MINVTKHCIEQFNDRYCKGKPIKYKDGYDIERRDKIRHTIEKMFQRSQKIDIDKAFALKMLIRNNYVRAEYYLDDKSNVLFVSRKEDGCEHILTCYVYRSTEIKSFRSKIKPKAPPNGVSAKNPRLKNRLKHTIVKTKQCPFCYEPIQLEKYASHKKSCRESE